MKDKAQILQELYATHFVENYTRAISNEIDRANLDDIVGELYLMICELPATLVKDIYRACGINGVRRYVSGIIIKQVKSTNSKVFKLYKRHTCDTTPASMVENWEVICERTTA